MPVTTEMIKQLRSMTNAGVLDCKRALDQTDGDLEKAAEMLRRQGLATAAEKAGRQASEGRIEAYVHPGNRLGVLVEVNCETDFVARTGQFITLCHDIALQIAASNPRWISPEDVPAEVIEQERRTYYDELDGDNKPQAVLERALEGKMLKFYEENCLLEQPFIRDEEKKIRELIAESIAILGENIIVRRFARYEIGS